jgi:hypothetical protein
LVGDLLGDPGDHLLDAALDFDAIVHLTDLLLCVLVDVSQLLLQLLHTLLASLEVLIQRP